MRINTGDDSTLVVGLIKLSWTRRIILELFVPYYFIGD